MLGCLLIHTRVPAKADNRGPTRVVIRVLTRVAVCNTFLTAMVSTVAFAAVTVV